MLIEALEDRFARKLKAQCVVEDNFFKVRSKDASGFDVWIREEGKSYTVGFDQWHEKYKDPTAALACFAHGLSNQCRLIVRSRTGTDYRWEVEQLLNGLWVHSGTFGDRRIAPWPFGRKRILQNDWLHDEREP